MRAIGFRSVFVNLAAFASLVCAAGPGFAQSITLSPEQQAMLDQLPPAQRQQALDALEQVQQQAGQQGASPEAEPETTPLKRRRSPDRRKIRSRSWSPRSKNPARRAAVDWSSISSRNLI
jgi:uncharacterized damage-inducible protein DinB